MNQKMNAELRETLELARSIDWLITFSEHHSANVPVKLAAERMRRAVLDACEKAIIELHKLWPSMDMIEKRDFLASIESGKIPAQDDVDPTRLPKLIEAKLDELDGQIATRRAAA